MDSEEKVRVEVEGDGTEVRGETEAGSEEAGKVVRLRHGIWFAQIHQER